MPQQALCVQCLRQRGHGGLELGDAARQGLLARRSGEQVVCATKLRVSMPQKLLLELLLAKYAQRL
jgi:hypothetical protein